MVNCQIKNLIDGEKGAFVASSVIVGKNIPIHSS